MMINDKKSIIDNIIHDLNACEDNIYRINKDIKSINSKLDGINLNDYNKRLKRYEQQEKIDNIFKLICYLIYIVVILIGIILIIK